MLSSSPRLHIPPESDFIPRFFLRHPHQQLGEQQIARILEVIFSKYRFVKEWQDERPESQSFLPQMPERTPAAFLDTLYTLYARQYRAVRWGDKTPIYASYVDLLNAIFPQAQFIHIIRDGRDVALSMLDKWGKSELHVDLYFAARNWVRRIRDVRASATQLAPGLFYELRYEALVQDPEKEVRGVCEFLGEPYFPQMARPHELGRERLEAGSFHAAVRRPPSASRVGRWRQEMSSTDQRLFQYVAGKLLVALNYEVVDLGAITFGERIQLAILATKYNVLQAGRGALQTLRLVPPI